MDSLLAQVEGRYDTQIECVEVAGHVLSVRSVRDTNALLDAIDPEKFMTDERLPYWAELWPSSIALARWVFALPELKGKRVLELGCGLGLAGIAAAKAGANVTMTDYDEDALLFARVNALMNLGEVGSERNVEFSLMDWRSPSAGNDFDMVLGSDIVYERRHHDWVLGALHQLLAPSGIALLTDPGRETGKVFADVARKGGYLLDTREEYVEWRGKGRTIVGFLLRPPGIAT